MKFILGKKLKMTQVFDETGKVRPATVLVAGPTTVTQTKSVESDGYNAVQVGFEETKESRLNKAQLGHQKKAGKTFKTTREFRRDDITCKVGDTFGVGDLFKTGDVVQVSGISKGKGFQGVVKRHNFSGGPRSHGQKHTERAPGSIGAQGVARVFKGKKMPGRTGGDRVTVKNLEVLEVDAGNNTLTVSGAIPGRRGTLVEVRSGN